MPSLRRRAGVVPLLVLALLGAGAPAASAATTPSPSPATVRAAYDARVVTLVNAARRAAGRKPLALSACADRYADQWSAHMASTGAFAHRTDLRRVMTTCAARGVGENIAYGNLTADQLMALWMGSPGHRANILDPTYTHLGVGTSLTSAGRVYGTQNFLRL